MTLSLWLLLCLTIKHFIIDFPLQGPFQYRNKGTYGHLGGILHAGLHTAGTFAIFYLVGLSAMLALWAALVDGIAHYHIDFAKMRINTRMGWGPTTHEQFWWLLGFDQLLHYLTYFALIVWLTP